MVDTWVFIKSFYTCSITTKDQKYTSQKIKLKSIPSSFSNSVSVVLTKLTKVSNLQKTIMWLIRQSFLISRNCKLAIFKINKNYHSILCRMCQKSRLWILASLHYKIFSLLAPSSLQKTSVGWLKNKTHRCSWELCLIL